MNKRKITDEKLRKMYSTKGNNKLKENYNEIKYNAQIYCNELENQIKENKIEMEKDFIIKNEQLKKQHIENMEKLKVENKKNDLDYIKEINQINLQQNANNMEFERKQLNMKIKNEEEMEKKKHGTSKKYE